MGIQILPPQLANQIAAGEVVERPASVVKELVENSLDAGATRIDIEIDRGGSKLIRIRDNGFGIPKDELALALSRHATSKLHSLDDLEAILSFGFRGEALASISSVSRLTLTSRTAQQAEAWQAHAEGVEMAVKVMPAAHPVGSTIEVVDLFFNTPARRRFLKSDKTEFTHIDEWLKRIALVRGDIHFTLSHNGKTVRNYRPATNEPQYLQRLTQVAGRPFAEQALRVECQHDDLRLSGYLQSPWSSVLTDTHYFYVNGRLVRDRLVNHAVRQAFAQKAEVEQPGYVLMLEIDPHQVDVNVHPAKHEVRFHQSRYVHDYILQALQSALEEADGLNLSAALSQSEDFVPLKLQTSDDSNFELTPAQTMTSRGVAAESVSRPSQAEASRVSYHQQNSKPPSAGLTTRTNAFGSMSLESRSASSGIDRRQRNELSNQVALTSYAQLLKTPDYRVQDRAITQVLPMPPVLDGKYWVLAKEQELRLLPIKTVALGIRSDEIETKLATGLIGQPLLMPVSVPADPDWPELLDEHQILIRQLGLELTVRYQQLIIKKVPPYLRDSQLAKVIPEWLLSLRFEVPSPKALALWLAQQSLMGFMSAPDIWAAYSQLTEERQQQIAVKAVTLPWQSWLEEQASE